MNIVQINCTYGNADSTGRNTLDLHRYLMEMGENSDVFTVKIHEGCLDSRVHLFSSQLDQMIHALYSRVFGRQGFFSRFATKKLIEELRKKKPDIVMLHVLHSNCINFPMLFKYLSSHDIAVMLVLHDCWYFTGHCCYYIEEGCKKWKQDCQNCPAIHKWNKSWFFDRAASNLRAKAVWYNGIKRLAVVGVSDWITKEAKESILKEASIIERVYNWVDVDTFVPADKKEIRARLGIPSERRVLLGVASYWSEQKGLYEMLKAAQEIEDVDVFLVGEVSPDIKIPSNVTSVGVIRQPERLAEYYAMADVFLNPSVQETFGKTTAEALSCGTPVVVYNTTACPELVNAERGAVVEFGNRDAFVEAVKGVLSNSSEYYSEKCRRFAVESFSRDKCLSEYHGIIRKMACVQ